MRLTQRQQREINDAAAKTFGPDANVILFVSRLDDQKRGGDIDLLVECPAPVENAGMAAARMAAKIQMQLGERKVDVLYTWPGFPPSPAHQAALTHGQPL
ncbi:MAG: nucleotidyltransferase domain-containing protein [Caldilineaceae bacterium]|jgi:predicted nucleotidyltransferase